jgi:hypothetical protein
MDCTCLFSHLGYEDIICITLKGKKLFDISQKLPDNVVLE